MKKEDFEYHLIIYPHGVYHKEGATSAMFKAFIAIKEPEIKNPDNASDQKESFKDKIQTFNLKEVDKVLGFIRSELDFGSTGEKQNRIQLAITTSSVSKNEGQLKNVPLYSQRNKNPSISPTFKTPDEILGISTSNIYFNRESFASLASKNKVPDEKVYDIDENDYDRILKKGRDFATRTATETEFRNDCSFNLITFYNKILEEPVLAENLGLIHTLYCPLKEIFSLYGRCTSWGKVIEYKLINSSDRLQPDDTPTFQMCRFGLGKKYKYYNGLAKPYLSSSDFECISVTFYDKYKKNLSQNSIPEMDGLYVNVKYKDHLDPFENKNIFGFNVLLNTTLISGQEQTAGNYHSLSLFKKEYYQNGESVGVDISSGHLLPKPSIQVAENEEYRAELLFAWKGENLTLNRLMRSRKIEQSEDEFDYTLTKFNDDEILNKLLEKNFSVVETFLPKTNPHLVANNQLCYHFYIRTVTPLNYYLETKKEWCLRNPGKKTPEEIFFIEDLKPNTISSGDFEFVQTEFPAYKIDAPIVIANELFDNENTPFVDSKNTMVVNIKDGEKLEKRFLYPARITWEKFKLLGYLNKERIGDENIDRYAKKCMRLEKRSLKDIRCRQGISKNINYLADPRAKTIEILPNDLFTAMYFANIQYKKDIPAKDIFNLTDNYPYYERAKGAKVEAESKGLTNRLLIGDIVFLNEVPLGSYAIKLHSDHPDIKNPFKPEEEDCEKNGEILNFAFIDRPSIPTVVKSSITTNRFNNGDINKWRLSYELDNLDDIVFSKKMFATKSFKFYEETEVLKLQHEKMTELTNHFKGNLNEAQLLKDEFPVELFIQKDGKLNQNLHTDSYPEKIKLYLQFEENLCVGKQEIFKLRLTEVDELSVVADSEGLLFKLWYNGASLTFSTKTIEGKCYYYLNLYIEYCKSQELYEIFSDEALFLEGDIKAGGTLCKSLYLKNLIDPEISIKDITVSQKLSRLIDIKNADTEINRTEINGLEYLSQTYNRNKIRLEREPREIILKDEGHPFYRRKTIKLFASSAFQGFFPKETMEKDIGTVGQDLRFHVPNNVKPKMPELDSTLLLYNHQQKSWDNGTISEERDFLVRISLDQAFMREGTNNKFAIVLGVYTDASFDSLITKSEETSLIGEDITKLLVDGAIENNNIERYINLKPKRPELIKYLINTTDSQAVNSEAIDKLVAINGCQGEVEVKKIYLNGGYYKILVTQPYYNIQLKRWQIVLSFKDSINERLNRSYEAFFIKLVGFKISYGHGVSLTESGYYIFNDTPNQTITSDFTEPLVLPVYNKKRYTLKRNNNKLTITNEGHRKNEKNKVYVLTKLKTRTESNIFIDGNDGNLLNSERIELNESNSFSFLNDNYRKIIIREFEMHDNYDNANKNFSHFPIKGLRLINYVQFKI